MDIDFHSLCNDVLGVSDEQAAAGVKPLPIMRGVIDGLHVVQSFWRPNAEEIKALVNGHPILLTIYGTTHTPLRVDVAAEKE